MFKRITTTLLAGMILFSASSLRAHGPKRGGGEGDEFKVLSWNIYMLPRFAKFTGKRKRARAIVDQLAQSDYDMIVFQEAFLGDSRNIIRNGLRRRFPHEFGPANKKFSIKANSGIWILSKKPMKYLGEISFSDCGGAADCMARKGALMVETEWQGQAVQVLGTHLEAAGPDKVRRNQMSELRKFLDRHQRDGVPQVVCGDMNTEKSDSSNYDFMIGELGVADGEISGEQKWTADGNNNDLCWGENGYRKVIDYIFIRPNGKKVNKVKREVPMIRKRWHKDHHDLSDHFPVSITVSFE